MYDMWNEFSHQVISACSWTVKTNYVDARQYLVGEHCGAEKAQWCQYYSTCLFSEQVLNYLKKLLLCHDIE